MGKTAAQVDRAMAIEHMMAAAADLDLGEPLLAVKAAIGECEREYPGVTGVFMSALYDTLVGLRHDPEDRAYA